MEAEVRETNKKRKKEGHFSKKKMIIGVVIIAILVGSILAIPVSNKINSEREHEIEVKTISTLEEIIDVSELSTFTAVYNGIAEIPNLENPDEIDFYVSYEAKVYAGIDFDQVAVITEKDDEGRVTVTVDLPEARIIDKNVDIGSLEFIIQNKDVDQAGISNIAYEACNADVKRESQKQGAILELAQQNAENIVEALTRPYLDVFLPGCELVIE